MKKIIFLLSTSYLSSKCPIASKIENFLKFLLSLHICPLTAQIMTFWGNFLKIFPNQKTPSVFSCTSVSILSFISVLSSSSKCLCFSPSFACSSISFNIVVWFCLSSSCTIFSVGATCLCSQRKALSRVKGSGCVVSLIASLCSPMNHAHCSLSFHALLGLSSSASTKRR